jgi:hypothetical protein
VCSRTHIHEIYFSFPVGAQLKQAPRHCKKTVFNPSQYSTKIMYDEEYRPPAGENRPISLRGVQDDEAKRQDEGCLDPVDKKLNQSKEDAKAKLKGSRPDSNAASATISSSGPAYIDNDMKTMPLPSEQDNPDKVSKARAARPSVQSSTSSAKKPTSTARSSVADKEAKAMARSQMVPSRVKRESGEANAKVLSSQEQLVADEEAKASVRNSMVPSRVRRSRGGDGDDELAAATVMEATVFPGSPSAIEDEEEEDSILPGAQKVHGPGAKLEANLNFDDLEATPSEKDDGRPAPGDKDNLEHATAIVAELVPTDTDVSEQLQKMVEDRFNQERKRQVVVEAVQAEPMGNDEQGGKICGVIVSKKYWLLLVVGLLVLVAVAVGAGVLGAAGGGDSGNSGPPKPRPIGVDNGDNDDNDGPEAPTAAPSISRRVELLEAIGATILENDPNALEPGTPTAQALNWMANVDEANLDFTTTRSSVLVERYALAAFYFATNGPTWFNRYNFLEATSVCSWNSVQSIAGVFCNGLSVQQIYFSKFLYCSRMSVPSYHIATT